MKDGVNMSYRGPGIQYRIRKTNTKNKTGDNYSITVPRIIAEKFDGCFFQINIQSGSLVFTSGCKIDAGNVITPEGDKYLIDGGVVAFR